MIRLGGIIEDSKVTLQIEATPVIIIYNRNVFIVQASAALNDT
jgi:hypothetical protein